MQGSCELTYYADGSPYTYGPGETAVNIGWLDRAVPYPQGETSPQFLAALKARCRNPTRASRGWHRCSFCSRGTGALIRPPTTVRDEEGDFIVGGAEVRVTGRNGVVYASPDMIAHYVEAHAYRPPKSFVEAVTMSR